MLSNLKAVAIALLAASTMAAPVTESDPVDLRRARPPTFVDYSIWQVRTPEIKFGKPSVISGGDGIYGYNLYEGGNNCNDMRNERADKNYGHGSQKSFEPRGDRPLKFEGVRSHGTVDFWLDGNNLQAYKAGRRDWVGYCTPSGSMQLGTDFCQKWAQYRRKWLCKITAY